MFSIRLLRLGSLGFFVMSIFMIIQGEYASASRDLIWSILCSHLASHGLEDYKKEAHNGNTD